MAAIMNGGVCRWLASPAGGTFLTSDYSRNAIRMVS
jgi:transketolase